MKKKIIMVIVSLIIATVIISSIVIQEKISTADKDNDQLIKVIGTIEIDLYDTMRKANSLVMYTKEYSRNEYGYEVLVEKSTNSIIDKDAVVQIQDGTYVLSGHGEAGLFLRRLDIGDTVEIFFNTVTVKRHLKNSNMKKVELENEKVNALIKQRKAELYDIDLSSIESIDIELNAQIDALSAYLDTLSENIPEYQKIIDEKMRSISNLIDQKYYATIEHRLVEGRAMWHRPNASAIDETTLDGVIKFAQRLYNMGINTLYVETFTCGMPIYYSELLQYQKPHMASYDYGEYGKDYLAALIGECHKLGIEVHAWFNVLDAEMPNGESPEYVSDEWICRDLSGSTDGKFLDASHPQVVEYLKKVIKEMLSKYEIDGISYDYIRYAESGMYNEEYVDSGFTSNSIEKFEKLYNYDGDIIEDVKNKTDIRAKWHEFKQNSINELLSELAHFIRNIDPEITISASPFGQLNSAKSVYMQDVRMWMDKGYIDVVLPMIYTDSVELLTGTVTDFDAYNQKILQYTGIYALYNKSTLKRNQEIIDALNSMGIAGNSLFASQNYINHEDEARDIVYQVMSSTTHKGRAVLPTADSNEIFAAWSSQLIDRFERLYSSNMSDTEKKIVIDFFAGMDNTMKDVCDVELMMKKLIEFRFQMAEIENEAVSSRICEQIDYLYAILDTSISRYLIRYGYWDIEDASERPDLNDIFNKIEN